MKYITFYSLCETLNKVLEQQIQQVHHANGNHIGIQLKNRYFPISINESEFNFMFNFIIDNKLKTGFELSTGTGISTIAIASAFKETEGHLITLDSYYEELTGVSQNIPIGNYTSEDIERIKKVSNCYKFATSAIQVLDLQNVVQFEIGWSPTDSINLIQKRNTPLDIVFFDCPKDDKEFERDLKSIHPFINKDKYVIFVHDTQNYTQKSFDLAKELFGVPMVQIYEYFKETNFHSKRYFPFAMITNIQ